MRKITCFLLIMPLMISPVQAADKWRNGTGEETLLGTETVSDIDASINQHIVEPLDRLLQDYRQGVQLVYNSVSTIDISSGSISCENSGGTITRMRQNTSTTTLTWSDLDSGSEASSTTYYVYAVCDADATTFTGVISTNSSTPSGVTYYKRLGEFTNDSGSDITDTKNDNERMIVSTGTVSNGATISLPSGWSQDECNWTVAINSYDVEDGIGGSACDGGGAVHNFSCTVNTSRVVSCTHFDGGCGSASSTANYIIACYR